jgi:hypothetical protein
VSVRKLMPNEISVKSSKFGTFDRSYNLRYKCLLK